MHDSQEKIIKEKINATHRLNTFYVHFVFFIFNEIEFFIVRMNILEMDFNLFIKTYTKYYRSFIQQCTR